VCDAGWNAKTVPLARQLLSAYVKANPRKRRPVVVLGEASKEAMDDKIRGAFTPQERGKLRVCFAPFETLYSTVFS